MFDLLGVVKQNISGDPTWATPQTAKTGYVFAAAIFWAFCFGMSRYSHIYGTPPRHRAPQVSGGRQ